MLIFGWGRVTTKDYGEIEENVCPNCNNTVAFHLILRRTWFTLFFIPIIPYENNYFVMCPVCSRGTELVGETLQKVKDSVMGNNSQGNYSTDSTGNYTNGSQRANSDVNIYTSSPNDGRLNVSKWICTNCKKRKEI